MNRSMKAPDDLDNSVHCYHTYNGHTGSVIMTMQQLTKADGPHLVAV